MIDLLPRIDQHASSGSGPWHRASALAKLAVAGGLVGLAVTSPSLTLLMTLHGLAWLLAATSRLPVRLVIAAAGYPVLFVSLYVVARWDGTATTPLALALRPLTASLAAVWLVGTTPYPDLFAPISRLLPRGAGDALFLTYRALFSLLSKAERLRQALRLRGGFTGTPRRRLAVVGEGLGTLTVHGFDRSERLYTAMLLRGHSGRVCGCRHFAHGTRADLGTAAVGLAVAVAGVLLWRTP